MARRWTTNDFLDRRDLSANIAQSFDGRNPYTRHGRSTCWIAEIYCVRFCICMGWPERVCWTKARGCVNLSSSRTPEASVGTVVLRGIDERCSIVTIRFQQRGMVLESCTSLQLRMIPEASSFHYHPLWCLWTYDSVRRRNYFFVFFPRSILAILHIEVVEDHWGDTTYFNPESFHISFCEANRMQLNIIPNVLVRRPPSWLLWRGKEMYEIASLKWKLFGREKRTKMKQNYCLNRCSNIDESND